ncbi:MAG TPA: hypothetical protein VG273_09015 [Bryobacteraceae bacterium]|nr:hypothetical protein [Bryobacteraceae bacterium]
MQSHDEQSEDNPATPELVTIRRFGDMSEALLAQCCLDSAGIESFLMDTNIARVEWPLTRGMRLQVESHDAAAAIALLDQASSAAMEQ